MKGVFLHPVLLASLLASFSLASPLSPLFIAPTVNFTTKLGGEDGVVAGGASYVPVVLMHGLGDAGSNPGMQSLAASISAAYPGLYSIAVDVADGAQRGGTPSHFSKGCLKFAGLPSPASQKGTDRQC